MEAERSLSLLCRLTDSAKPEGRAPQGLKPFPLRHLSARLKPCPDVKHASCMCEREEIWRWGASWREKLKEEADPSPPFAQERATGFGMTA